MKRVLVTGGAGFIGSHLTDHLLARGYFVRVLDNLRNGSKENLHQAAQSKNFEFLMGDITSAGDCERALEGIDLVFHLACLGVRHSLHSPFENHQVNAEGSLRVLEACRKQKVNRFFYISTSEVYGKVEQFPITESALPQPITVYGASKLAGEHYAQSFRECYGLDTTVLRIFNNYGPRAHYEGDSGEVIPRSIVRALQGESPVLFGDGKVTRDFFYVKDTARALESLVARDDICGKTFNIGTGNEITMRALVEQVLSVMNSNVGISYLGARPADVPRLWVDSSRFHRLTGFQAEYSFERGLSETIDFYRALVKKGSLREMPTANWEKTK